MVLIHSPMALTLKRFTVGPLQENCYLLSDAASKQAVLIDPGDEADLLLRALRDAGMNLQAVWLTHAHFDHIGALADIEEALEVPVYLHPAELPLYGNAAQAAQHWEMPFRQPKSKTLELADAQTLTLGDTEVHCLLTPGHAPGHIAFYVPSEGMVLAGDALFQGSIGRTDLPMGNHEQLLESVKTKRLTLPDATVVYPGHGPETTVGREKQTNPFLQ
ncbi:MBL fold metallo-hydrolase [soil metagenome]